MDGLGQNNYEVKEEGSIKEHALGIGLRKDMGGGFIS